jgi:hypothetical protein
MQNRILAFLLEVPDRAARGRLLTDAFTPPATDNSLDVDTANSPDLGTDNGSDVDADNTPNAGTNNRSDVDTDNGTDMDRSLALSDEAAQIMGIDMHDEGITSGNRQGVEGNREGTPSKGEGLKDGETGGGEEDAEEQLFTTPLQLLQVCFENITLILGVAATFVASFPF